MDFKKYYKSQFREDINRFFSEIPDESKFHEDQKYKQTLSIQYERLTPEMGHLNFLDREGKEYFGISLFLTVLLDMMCFSKYKPYYQKFTDLTRYPKFIGNCPSGCHYHYHPQEIFLAMTKNQKPTEPHLNFREKFMAEISTMEEEVISFFSKHLTEINGQEFWSLCQTEFPYKS